MVMEKSRGNKWMNVWCARITDVSNAPPAAITAPTIFKPAINASQATTPTLTRTPTTHASHAILKAASSAPMYTLITRVIDVR